MLDNYPEIMTSILGNPYPVTSRVRGGRKEIMTLPELKTGDTVTIVVGTTPIATARVTEVTPDGFLKVAGNYYTLAGYLKDIEHDEDYDQRIEIPSASQLDRIERRELLRKIDGANLRQLPVDILRKIADLLD